MARVVGWVLPQHLPHVLAVRHSSLADRRLRACGSLGAVSPAPQSHHVNTDGALVLRPDCVEESVWQGLSPAEPQRTANAGHSRH